MRMLAFRNSALGMVLACVSGCATLSTPQDQKLTITKTTESVMEAVAYKVDREVVAYKWGTKEEVVEWIGCFGEKSKATVLLMHADKAGFEAKELCDSWMAQPFLSKGFDVLAINRPGYGSSTGVPDFTGPQSIEALSKVLQDIKLPLPLTGIWGYSTGASAAGLAAKRLPGLKFAILGGGIYDYHEALRLTRDSYLKKDLETILKTAGEKGFEDRSIAYDLKGLPPRISIYHGKNDVSAPLSQATAFADSLASIGHYTVNFQVIDGMDHEIPWQHHRKLLEVLARSEQ